MTGVRTNSEFEVDSEAGRVDDRQGNGPRRSNAGAGQVCRTIIRPVGIVRLRVLTPRRTDDLVRRIPEQPMCGHVKPMAHDGSVAWSVGPPN